MNRLLNCQSKGHSVSIYVPKDALDSGIGLKSDLELCKVKLCELFGGCTIHPVADGFWCNPDSGDIEIDSVHIVTAYFDRDTDTEANLNEVYSLAVRLANRLHQSCIAVVYDGIMYFVEPY